MTLAPTFSRKSLLGIRFWDAAMNQPIEGLQVLARAYGSTFPKIQAVRTPSGYYSFHGLPGMASVEQGASSGPARTFLIEVDDPQQRFLGVSFPLELPLSSGPIYPPLPGGDEVMPGTPPGFLLFSSPLRRRGVGIAGVRASLCDKTTLAPIPYAVLQVKLPDESLWYGISNAQGEALVLFPYPTFEVDAGEGDDDIPVPLSEQSWSIEASVLYNPAALVYAPHTSRPDLSSIFLQPAGNIWEEPGALSGLPVVTTSLTFDEERVLRTGTLSRLWVEMGEMP